MLLKTILSSIEKYKGFVYKDIKLVGDASNLKLEVMIEPRRNSRGVCSGCGDLCAGYDTQRLRLYEYIPLWGVYFLYCPRRLDCPECGVHVEQVPWAVGKHRLTQRYAWFFIEMGQAFELERDSRVIWYQLASCIPFCRDGSDLGAQA